MAIKLMSLFTRFFSDSRCTRYLEFAYILLLPIAVWALYRFSPFNNNDGFLDSWLYFGYAHNFQDLIDRYGLPYYSVRFGLIFPLITLIEIFGPIKGYLAFVYSMYLLAGVPLYLLFRKHFSVHAAVLAYTILVSSVWFARTVLWTHPDAAAVPYLIAALALMFLEPGYRRVANFAIGVLMALAVNSNFFALSIGGLISVAYLTYFKNNLWSRIRQDVPWTIGGFALIFVAGSAGYYACCGQNYFTNTLNMLKWSARGEGAVYQAPIMALLNLHYIYLLPFFVVLMYVVSKQAKVESNRLLLAVTYYLIAVITFVVWYQFAFSTALLETYYYFSFFLVPSVVCIALIPVILAKASNSVTHSLNIALASFLLPPLIVAYGFPFSFDNVPIHLLLLSLGFALLLILLTTRYRKVTPYAIICFALSIQVSLLSTVIQGVPFYARMYGIADEFGLSRYRLGLKFIEVMPKFKEENRPIYFWYSNADPLANSLQSTYLWGYSRLPDFNNGTGGFPGFKGENVDFLGKHEKSSLVLFDRDMRNVIKGIEELRHIDGLHFKVKQNREICEQNICYSIAVLDVNRAAPKIEQDWQEGKGRPLNVTLDWSQPGAGAVIDHEGTITSVVTHPKAWNYGAVASMTFSEERSTRPGVVRVLLTVKEANAGISFTGSNISNFIKRVEILPKNEPQEVYFEFENLGELHHFIIQTWDQDKSAKVQILEFSARELPRP